MQAPPVQSGLESTTAIALLTHFDIEEEERVFKKKVPFIVQRTYMRSS